MCLPTAGPHTSHLGPTYYIPLQPISTPPTQPPIQTPPHFLFAAGQKAVPVQRDKLTEISDRLVNFPLIRALIQEKTIIPDGDSPLETIFLSVKKAAQERFPSVANVESIESWEDLEEVVNREETVLNLIRMRPILQQHWTHWISNYKAWLKDNEGPSGEKRRLVTKYENFQNIADQELESALTWLSKVPHSFKDTKVLNFDGCELTLIPQCLADLPLTSLHSLSFNDNCITHLTPSCFNRCVELRGFFMAHNRLYKLPDNLGHNWHSLETLSFSHNEISTIPYQLPNHCLSLKVLDFGSNLISQIPPPLIEGFKTLSQCHLHKLDLSKNCLSEDGVASLSAFLTPNPPSEASAVL